MKTKFFLFVLCFLALFGCQNKEKKVESFDHSWENSKVVLVGYDELGWVENTNTFPVTVRCVDWNEIRGGEQTRWVHQIDPNTCFHMYVKHSYGFYIHRTGTGELIGFVKPALELD